MYINFIFLLERTLLYVFFFFQAEDGIRDGRVTGVQTCALPIWALYRAYFVDNVDISSADGTIAVCAKLGLAAGEVRAGIGDQAIKDRTRTEVDKAIARGAFGSPYIIVDGEPFWGSDRLDQIDKWLASGGW